MLPPILSHIPTKAMKLKKILLRQFFDAFGEGKMHPGSDLEALTFSMDQNF
jgi:hypothetical protein